MVKKLATVAAGVFALVAVTSGAAFAAGPSKCSGGKVKNVGKKAAAKLTCLSKAVGKGGTQLDSTCVAKAEVKFSTVVAKAEAKSPNDCITTGDAATLEATVDTLVSNIDALVAGPNGTSSACDAAKVKAAGKKAAAKLGCAAKAVTKNIGVDGTCVAKAETKFSTAVAKAEAKTYSDAGCTATGDANSYESAVDAAFSCQAILTGNPIVGTYNQGAGSGPKICSTNATANKFGTCSTDADCGSVSGSCFQTPWVTVGNFPAQATPAGTTKFTVTAEGGWPFCEHQACVKCGNPAAACAGIPGCVGNSQCVQSTCCDDPGFKLPALFISGIGACTRVDQIACGTGVVNTSNPQTGDNEIIKNADSSKPGNTTTCDYTGAPSMPCSAAPGGQAQDQFGKIERIIGNGSPDANGMQIRLQTPGLTTAWSGDTAGCPTTATFDGGTETVLTSLILRTEPSTAGAKGAWVDMNGDSCARPLGAAGFGPNAPPDGPVTVPSGASASPAPYGGAGGSMSAAIGEVFSGLGAAGYDIGFVAVTPNGALSAAAADSCSCVQTKGCPE